jgi:hypothetical protein
MHATLVPATLPWRNRPTSASKTTCPPRYAESPPAFTPSPPFITRPRLHVLLHGLSFRGGHKRRTLGESLEAALHDQQRAAQSHIALIDRLRRVLNVSTAIFTYPTVHTSALREMYRGLSASLTLLEPDWCDERSGGVCPSRFLSRQRRRCLDHDIGLFKCPVHENATWARAAAAHVTKLGNGGPYDLQRSFFAQLEAAGAHGEYDAALLLRLDLVLHQPHVAAERLLAAAARGRIAAAFRIGDHCDYCCLRSCKEGGSSGCQSVKSGQPRAADTLHWVPSAFFGLAKALHQGSPHACALHCNPCTLLTATAHTGQKHSPLHSVHSPP